MGQKPAEGSLKCCCDIVDRSSQDMVAFTVYSCLLCENGLRVDSSHAEKGYNPHPENGAGPACQDGTGGADDISRTDLSRYGSGQSLE